MHYCYYCSYIFLKMKRMTHYLYHIWWHTQIQKCGTLFISCCLCVWVCPVLAFSNRFSFIFIPHKNKTRPDDGDTAEFFPRFPFEFFLAQYLTLCHPGTKQSDSDTHKIRCTYLWDSSAAPFYWNTKKPDLSESFICLLSAPGMIVVLYWTCGLVSCFEVKSTGL